MCTAVQIRVSARARIFFRESAEVLCLFFVREEGGGFVQGLKVECRRDGELEENEFFHKSIKP